MRERVTALCGGKRRSDLILLDFERGVGGCGAGGKKGSGDRGIDANASSIALAGGDADGFPLTLTVQGDV